MDSIDQRHAPSYRIALFHLLRNPLPEYVDPTCYLKASGETLAFLIAVCWCTSILVTPDLIAANPLNTRLGYYTLCVGLDSFPANRIGLVLFVPSAYFGMRFVWTDTMLAVLEREQRTNAQYWSTVATNGCYAISLSLFALVFVESPFHNHYLHTAFFIQLIIFRLLVVGANFYEAPVRTKASNAFFVVYAIVSLVLPVLYMVDFLWYDEVGAVVIPWPIVAAFDYGWFACLALTTKFLPQANCIRATWSLESD